MPIATSLRCIVVVDMVESVRLLQAHERDVIGRWLDFVDIVRREVLPKHQGRLARSLGDGLLLDFERVGQAVRAALEILERVHRHNLGVPDSAVISLRAGVHRAEVLVDALDLFGSGVNIAARITTRANPGEVVVTLAVRESLVPPLDADVVDLGECYFKHFDQPIRVFRLLRDTTTVRIPRPPTLAPHVAVLPLSAAHGEGATTETLARVATDDLVAAMARVRQWSVMSRLSTDAIGTHGADPAAVHDLLHADVFVSGGVAALGSRVAISLVATEQLSGAPLWEHRVELESPALLSHGSWVEAAVTDLAECVVRRQTSLVHAAAMTSLPGYALLLGAVTMLHRLGGDDFARAREALEHLAERHPRSPEVQAWLAKWHFLQLAQARAASSDASVSQAESSLGRALDLEPSHPLALALSGHLRGYARHDLPGAVALLHQAVASGPNEPLAWLFLSNALAGAGRTDEAVHAAQMAAALSPLDPLGYYFDLFAAAAHSAAGQHVQALALAERSVRRNALHLSSWIQLIVEQVLTSRMDEARRSVAHYLTLRPNASVDRFRRAHVAGDSPLVDRDARALLEAGMPL